VSSAGALGKVESVGSGTVRVRLVDGSVVVARNALTARCPPLSEVVVVELRQAGGGRLYEVVGRSR
jgi:hypothetical protein